MNKTIMNRPELLAPGGSFTSVKAAFCAGADAVYMGGSKFSARAYAESVNEEHSLENAIDYAHLYGRRLYVTINTLLKEEELKGQLYDYVLPLYEQGVDAVLVQDLGVLHFLHQEFPDLPLHASTQMTIMNPDGAALLREEGLTRVVAPRELNLQELKALARETGMELEAFIHGAICYCYSGQCLYSGVIGGRSGNRGRCAQPCRLNYQAFDEGGRRLNPKDEPCLLSLKDMNTLRFLPDLMEAGVLSYKIEGRMKSPVYTAGVVSIYRKYMDLYLEGGRKGYRVDDRDEYALTQFFDRGGTTDYLTRHNGRDMMALKEKPRLRLPDQKLLDEVESRYVGKDPRLSVDCFAAAFTGIPASVTYMHGDLSVTAESDEPVSPAKKSPVDEAALKKQFGKTGNTPFEVEHFEASLSEDAFLPVQKMNQMRREALKKLENEILALYQRRLPEKKAADGPGKPAADGAGKQAADGAGKWKSSESGHSEPQTEERNQAECPESADEVMAQAEGKNTKKTPLIILETMDPAQLDRMCQCRAADIIYLNSHEISFSDLPQYAKRVHDRNKELYLVVSRIMRKPAVGELLKNADSVFSSGIDGIVVGSLDGLGLLARLACPLPIVLDHSFYTWNEESISFVKELCRQKKLKLVRTTAPLELNDKELKRRGMENSELMIYGAIPMMISAGCIRQTTGGCNHKHDRIRLVDRKNTSFTDVAYCKYCYNVIYNSVPVFLLDKLEDILSLSPAGLRLSFMTESADQVDNILSLLESGMMGNPSKMTGRIPENITRGHFLRGVQ